MRMSPSIKRRRRGEVDESDSEEVEFDDMENVGVPGDEESEDEESADSLTDGEDEHEFNEGNVSNLNAEMGELELEYQKLRNQERDILENLKAREDSDARKGEAVKNQKLLWGKSLELRILLQKPFSNSNKLPPGNLIPTFCDTNDGLKDSYSDLVNSSKQTLEALVELQDALIKNDPSINEEIVSSDSHEENDDEWKKVSESTKRIASFRDKSVDKWYRKTQVTSGSAASRQKLQAFNQNISEQVANFMRDPKKMATRMQMKRTLVGVFGLENGDEDPELLDDSDFYQQLLKEFLESVDPSNTEKALYALKRSHAKKRKDVDRKASKSRKIRYNVHEKIVNFMAPRPMEIPPMASHLFSNLFGLKTL